jgi:hypothetical protein
MLAESYWGMEADGMGGAALIMLGRDDPHFVRKFGGYGFQHGEAGCIDTVVVSQQNAFKSGPGCGHCRSPFDRGKRQAIDYSRDHDAG